MADNAAIAGLILIAGAGYLYWRGRGDPFLHQAPAPVPDRLPATIPVSRQTPMGESGVGSLLAGFLDVFRTPSIETVRTPPFVPVEAPGSPFAGIFDTFQTPETQPVQEPNPTATRCVRNNNPGCIRRTSTDWIGETGTVTDATFEEFTSPEYGIRAMARTLRTYKNTYGDNTIRKVVSRWAPHSENPTDNYVQFVANQVGVSADQPIDITSDQFLPQIIAAMIQFENGEQPYSLSTILRGIQLERV